MLEIFRVFSKCSSVREKRCLLLLKQHFAHVYQFSPNKLNICFAKIRRYLHFLLRHLWKSCKLLSICFLLFSKPITSNCTTCWGAYLGSAKNGSSITFSCSSSSHETESLPWYSSMRISICPSPYSAPTTENLSCEICREHVGNCTITSFKSWFVISFNFVLNSFIAARAEIRFHLPCSLMLRMTSGVAEKR